MPYYLNPSNSVFNSKFIIRFFKSFISASKDKDLEQRISNLGLKSFYLPNIVKLNKFKFVNSDIPSEIKKQINPQKKYLLQIGHLKNLVD